MRSLRKVKDRIVVEGIEEVREMGVDIIVRSEVLGFISEFYSEEFSEIDREEVRVGGFFREGGEISIFEFLKVIFKF